MLRDSLHEMANRGIALWSFVVVGIVALLLTSTAQTQAADGGIFRWDGQGWVQVPGAAVRISAGPDGSPFVVNSGGGIYRWVNGGFQQMPGLALDIGVGADGSVWMVGSNQGIYRWNGQGWSQVPGTATRISVGPDGSPWVVNAWGAIYRWANGGFQQMPGLGRDIGVGADGSVWVIGTGQGIYRWNGQGWIGVAGTALEISVGSNGAPWVVNAANEIYRWDGTKFVKLPSSATDISVGAKGTAWMIGSGTVTTVSTSAPPGSISVSPGQSIQAAVNAAPEGATFWIKAGVHRLQSVTPKNLQTFVGAPGAVLSGAKILTSFSREGSYWVATGQTQQGPVLSHPEACQTAFPRCGYPEDLFIDNVVLQHVATLSAVGPGKWYFDYTADKIYFGNDPTGRTVETSVTPTAFVGGYTHDVTIRGLIIEKYATPSPKGAIDGSTRWVVEDNQVRWNHHSGVRGTDYMRVRRNYVHHNGGYGFTGTGAGMLYEDNEIAFNNTVGYNPNWGAGGTKWVATTGLVVRRNFSHHNKGQGLWTDIDNIDTLYEYNRSEDNDLDGIFHELSYRAIIRYNTCQRNGVISPFPGWVTGGGITVNSSPDVEVYGNTIVNNFNGIGGIQTPRGSGKYGPYLLQNFNVHHNTVTMAVGQTGIVQYGNLFNVYTSQNNRFANNTYFLGSKATYFTWSISALDENGWRSFGNDVSGTFSR